MQVDRQQFKEEGYNILREVVPKAELEPLRRNIEHMVDRRKEVSAQRRFPSDPQGGDWESSAQPRLQFHTDCDEMSDQPLNFCFTKIRWGSANS